MAEGSGQSKGIFIAEVIVVILSVGLLLFARKAPYAIAFQTIFIAIVLEALPFMLLGAFVSGLVEVFVAKERIWKLVPRNKVLAVLSAGLLGMVLPVCECGVVVVMRRLVKKGLPFYCAVTYMLAAPILNVVVLGSTALAFQGKPDEPARLVVSLRAGMGYVIAIVVGLVCAYFFTRQSALLESETEDDAHSLHIDAQLHDQHAHAPAAQLEGILTPSLIRKYQAVATHATVDFIDVGRFLILGAVVAAAMQTFIPRSALVSVGASPAGSISMMMVLAVMLNLCSEADAFVAASFVQFTLASKLAFLVLGPMFDIKLLLMYLSVFRRKLIITLPIMTTIGVFILAYLVHLLR